MSKEKQVTYEKIREGLVKIQAKFELAPHKELIASIEGVEWQPLIFRYHAQLQVGKLFSTDAVATHVVDDLIAAHEREVTTA